jgi:hypothetical protein
MSEINIEDFITEVETEPRKYKKGFARIKAAFSLNWKNAIKHPIDSVKTIIILYLDENPLYCWADLVCWSIDYMEHPFFDLFRYPESYQVTGCGYCGKCEVKED